MAQISYAERAQEDLLRIADFLAQKDQRLALDTLELIEEAINILANHPYIGRSSAPPLRELVISHGSSGYVALYWVNPAGDRVLILSIRHQRESGFRPLTG